MKEGGAVAPGAATDRGLTPGYPVVKNAARLDSVRGRPLRARVPADHAGGLRPRSRVLEDRAIVAEPLIRVEHLVKRFPVTRGVLPGRTTGQVKAVDGVSFTIGRQEPSGWSASPAAARRRRRVYCCGSSSRPPGACCWTARTSTRCAAPR